MKRVFFFFVSVFAVAGIFYRPLSLFAEPTSEALRSTIRNYVSAEEKTRGFFAVVDPKTGMDRKLKLQKVHERVGKTGNYYYSCADLKDTQTGDLLDLDFDVSDANNELKVVAVRIHKDNGKPRYTYDDKDNIIPVAS